MRARFPADRSWQFHLEREQSGAESLALGVGAEGNGAAAAQRLVQQKIQGAEIRQLEAARPGL